MGRCHLEAIDQLNANVQSKFSRVKGAWDVFAFWLLVFADWGRSNRDDQAVDDKIANPMLYQLIKPYDGGVCMLAHFEWPSNNMPVMRCRLRPCG